MVEVVRPKYTPATFFQDFGLVFMFVAVVAALVVLSPNAFARPQNLIGIVKQASINGVLSIGMMFVILAGGIDLSVGSIVAFTGVIAASLAHPGEHALAVAIVAPIVVGAVIGAFNGFSVARGGIPPFIVTLASMIMFRGAALIFSNGAPVFNVSDGFEQIAGGFVLSYVPYLVVYFAIITAIAAFVLRQDSVRPAGLRRGRQPGVRRGLRHKRQRHHRRRLRSVRRTRRLRWPAAGLAHGLRQPHRR